MFENDIDPGLAVRAFEGTSFSPEKRGASYRKDYADTLTHDQAVLHAHAEQGGTLDMLAAEFDRYRAGYAKRMSAWLHSHSRCISSMITGPSNFPVRRAEKRNAVEHARLSELIAYRERALKAATRNLRPDLRPIMAGDADALTRIEAELARLNGNQARMKAINAAHAAWKRKPETLADADLSESDKALIQRYVPNYSWEPHPFAPFQLTNNGANIRRLEKRLESVARARATPQTEQQGDGVRLEDCPADNRVRLFFDGKPDAEIRTRLKKNGFRWSPTIGAWQAYRNSSAMAVAQSFVEKP